MCKHENLKFYPETSHVICLDCGEVWGDRTEAPAIPIPTVWPAYFPPEPMPWPPYFPYTGDPPPFLGPIITCF